jgi:hypothetical protein
LNELIRQFVDMSLPAFFRSAPNTKRRLCGRANAVKLGAAI